MKKTRLMEQRDAFFKDRFNRFYAEWKSAASGHTQKAFAQIVDEHYRSRTGEDKSGVANYTVSAWSKGKWYPDKYLPDIAFALGIEESDLTPAIHDDMYQNVSDFTSDIARTKMTAFCEEIGLDVTFIENIRSAYGNSFDKVFPVWTPIRQNPNPFSSDFYIRADKNIWADSAEVADDVKCFQFDVLVENEDGEKEKRKLLLSEQDLLYLRDVQQQVKKYIDFLFYDRRKAMRMEVLKANKASQQKMPGKAIANKTLTAEELNDIDEYFHDYEILIGEGR